MEQSKSSSSNTVTSLLSYTTLLSLIQTNDTDSSLLLSPSTQQQPSGQQQEPSDQQQQQPSDQQQLPSDQQQPSGQQLETAAPTNIQPSVIQRATSIFSPILAPIPTIISPVLSPTPSIPLRNQSTSKKFNELNTLRKKSFLPLNTCTYIFRKGSKKGEKCIKPCPSDQVLCNLHLKSNDNVNNTTHVSNRTVHYIPTRINRLRKFKKYFFVKVVKQTTVVLKCEGEQYILRLPKGMLNPERPCDRHYLIREGNGAAVWKCLPN